VIRNPLNARGFTLIEVLVALSVLGVTMAAAAGLLRTGLRLRAEARDHLAFERDARAFVGALRDDCANLVAAAPGPLVSSDALVLWRAPDGSADGTAQIVSYQWSVSTTGDSLLVRVAAPMQAAATDPDAIREECRRWIGLAGESGETGLLIRQDGGRRFGERAERPGLTGSWVGYPAIGAAAFAQGDG